MIFNKIHFVSIILPLILSSCTGNTSTAAAPQSTPIDNNSLIANRDNIISGVEQQLLNAGIAGGVVTAAAPADIDGRTLILDSSQCSWKVELNSDEFKQMNGNLESGEYQTWQNRARDFVAEKRRQTISFNAGHAFESGCSTPYTYTAGLSLGTVIIQYGEGNQEIKLHFQTPTSGVAETVHEGAIGTEHSNTIRVWKVNFTLQ